MHRGADLPSDEIDAKAEDLARTFAGALNYKHTLVTSSETN